MNRIRQTFSNKLSEPIVIWVELECWCWMLQPGEALTAEFDEKGYGDWEPLPIEFSTDGEGDDRYFMVTLYHQRRSLSLSIGDRPLVVDDVLTPYGGDRFVSG